VGDDCEEYKRKGERRRRLFRSEKSKRFEDCVEKYRSPSPPLL
jgi:hypothetical protein